MSAMCMSQAKMQTMCTAMGIDYSKLIELGMKAIPLINELWKAWQAKDVDAIFDAVKTLYKLIAEAADLFNGNEALAAQAVFSSAAEQAPPELRGWVDNLEDLLKLFMRIWTIIGPFI